LFYIAFTATSLMGKWRFFVALTLEQRERQKKLVASPFLDTLNPPKVHDKSKKRKCLIETVVNTIPPSNILISQMLYPNEGKLCNDSLLLQK